MSIGRNFGRVKILNSSSSKQETVYYIFRVAKAVKSKPILGMDKSKNEDKEKN